MKAQESKMVSLESYRELEATCRLWMAACEAREHRVEELEREVRALQLRVARLSRQAQRQIRVPSAEQARSAR